MWQVEVWLVAGGRQFKHPFKPITEQDRGQCVLVDDCTSTSQLSLARDGWHEAFSSVQAYIYWPSICTVVYGLLLNVHKLKFGFMTIVAARLDYWGLFNIFNQLIQIILHKTVIFHFLLHLYTITGLKHRTKAFWNDAVNMDFTQPRIK